MNNLYWLSQITSAEKSLVGNKIFLLSQFLQDDFPIIPGFIVGSLAFDDFIAGLDDSQSLIGNLPQSSLHLNVDDYQALRSVGSKSRQAILDGVFAPSLQAKIEAGVKKLNSPQLIIRPSLVVSQYQQRSHGGFWQSQVCSNNSAAIIQAIKQVWAELFSAKSLVYWHKLGISLQQIKLAVLIQPIDNAIASGTIALSSQQAQIRASWGLGHSIQRGEVDADCYVVDLATANIISQNVGLKTRGYGLTKIESEVDPTNVLQSYLIEEFKQEQVVLKPQQINQLIQLATKIFVQNPHIRYLEWTLPLKHTTSQASNFFFTQLDYFTPAYSITIPQQPHEEKADQYPDLPKNISHKLTSFHNFPIDSNQGVQIKGVSASGGRVTAEIKVYDSLSQIREPLPPGLILVSKEIQPQHIPLIHNAAGIITEIGGQTSHGAIMARELGIPAVVAATEATKILQTGNFVTLDGNEGIVSVFLDRPLIINTDRRNLIQKYYENTGNLDVPLATQLMVNLSQTNLIESTSDLPIDGVGLLRGEFMVMELLATRPFSEWLQPQYQEELLNYLKATIRKFIFGFAPRPIYYRTLDFPLTNHNSVLGIRGTYAYLVDSTFFQLELTALTTVMAETESNLKLILPFVRSVSEWQFCADLVKKSGLTNYPEFQLWMMAEVPSVIFTLPEYISAGVQGIAIGMNDLTQLLLGIDREQETLAQQGFKHNSLAIEKAIASLIKTAKNHQIPCSICLTPHLQNSYWIDKLIRWGVTIISVEPHTVPDTYRTIARAEKRLLLDL